MTKSRHASAPRATTSAADRFWSKVDKGDGSGCWLWTSATDTDGYGVLQLSNPRRLVKAHRLSYEISISPISVGFMICHTCDVPLCVNPAHLFLGTNTDNMRDMAAKGRAATGDKNGARLHPERLARGEAHWRSKLTAFNVDMIRARVAAGEAQRSVARSVGVSDAHVSRIVRGKARAR